MIYKGFKFGMLLQLAVGPICALIFKIAGNKGFVSAEIGVAAVVLADALFILFAILGLGSFVGKSGTRNIFKYIGALVVAGFGFSFVLEVLGWKIMPDINLFKNITAAGPFVEAFILTAANPLTIVFWAGVFSTRIAEGKMTKKDVYLFGAGCALSTLISLTLVAAIGSLTQKFLPVMAIQGLNLLIGLVLIYFAGKMVFKMPKKEQQISR